MDSKATKGIATKSLYSFVKGAIKEIISSGKITLEVDEQEPIACCLLTSKHSRWISIASNLDSPEAFKAAAKASWTDIRPSIFSSVVVVVGGGGGGVWTTTFTPKRLAFIRTASTLRSNSPAITSKPSSSLTSCCCLLQSCSQNLQSPLNWNQLFTVFQLICCWPRRGGRGGRYNNNYT